MRIIDFHAHLDDHWFDKELPSTPAFLNAMDRIGIETACVFTVMGLYGDCRRHNDALLARVQAHPTRLIPFATVDPKEGPSAVAELERCLANRIFRGVKLHPWLQAFAPSMLRETVIEIHRLAARHDVPVLYHDGTPPYSTSCQVADTARWVPEATVVLGHAGLADYADAAAQLIRDIPNLFGCFCGSRPGELLHLVNVGGADKILFGSDFGAAGWQLLAERLDNVLEAGLTADDLEKILYGNAARLLRLSERPLPGNM